MTPHEQRKLFAELNNPSLMKRRGAAVDEAFFRACRLAGLITLGIAIGILASCSHRDPPGPKWVGYQLEFRQ